MNEIESQPTPPADNETLVQSVETLRKQFQMTLVILILLSLAVNWFLLYQFVISRKQLTGFEQVVADYQHNSLPRINEFLKRLSEFAKTNPDFAPILAKYPIQVTPAATNKAVPAPAGMAAPAKPVTPTAPAKAPATKTPAPAPAPKK